MWGGTNGAPGGTSHESTIEPWLPPINRVLLVALGTDGLRRKEAMKTTAREIQKRYGTSVASRDQGTEGENIPAQWGGLDVKEKIRPHGGS